MTTHDPKTAQERALRDRLHAELVPPTTPDRLRLAVADLGEREMADARNRRARWGRGGFAALRGLRAGVAVVAVVAVAVVATVAIVNLSGRQSVATTPHPTLPPVTGSPLPSGAPLGTRVTISQGGWISSSVAWAEDFASNLHLTIDGGLTWSTHPGLADTGEISWLDAANGYYVSSAAAGGDQAVTAYFTHDGGLHWTGTAVGSFASVDGQDNALHIHFVDPQHGVAFGTSWDYVRPTASDQPTGMTPSDCRAWTTDDGGATWTPETNPPCVLYGVAWSSPTMGTITYAYGDHTVAVTVDGGRTWTHGQIPGSAADVSVNAYLLTKAADGSLRLVAASTPGSWSGTIPTNVLVSTDSGASWSLGYEAAGVDGGKLRGVTALDAEHWLATVSGDVTAPTPVPATVLETFDAGRSWAQVATLGTSTIDIGDGVRWVDRLHGSVPGVDMGPCLAGGGSCGGGTLWLTNDGGLTWHGVPF
jgi:hypothetical protein